MPVPLSELLFFGAVGLFALFAFLTLGQDVIEIIAGWLRIVPMRPVYGTPRSGKWPTLEKKWLELHPNCAACGGDTQVSVHHKKPFHLHPDLELDPTNLISLCERHCCHLMVGHSGDWHAYNPHVADDAKFLAARIANRKYQ